jgi:hypothetical protein
MPELRCAYNVDAIRQIMLVAMMVSSSLTLYNILLNRVRWLSIWAFGLLLLLADLV